LGRPREPGVSSPVMAWVSGGSGRELWAMNRRPLFAHFEFPLPPTGGRAPTARARRPRPGRPGPQGGESGRARAKKSARPAKRDARGQLGESGRTCPRAVSRAAASASSARCPWAPPGHGRRLRHRGHRGRTRLRQTQTPAATPAATPSTAKSQRPPGAGPVRPPGRLQLDQSGCGGVPGVLGSSDEFMFRLPLWRPVCRGSDLPGCCRRPRKAEALRRGYSQWRRTSNVNSEESGASRDGNPSWRPPAWCTATRWRRWCSSRRHLIAAKLGGELLTAWANRRCWERLVVGWCWETWGWVGLDLVEPLKHDAFIDIWPGWACWCCSSRWGSSRPWGSLKVGVARSCPRPWRRRPFALAGGVGAWLLPRVVRLRARLPRSDPHRHQRRITARVLKDLNRSQTNEARIILARRSSTT